MKFIKSLFASIVGATTLQAAAPAPVQNPAEMMRQMRLKWLTTAPAAGTYTIENEVVAVLMDWPLGDQTVTVLSSSGGDASLYTTSTFGIIGGIGHEKVRKAAKDFVGCAQHYYALTKPTDKFPYPDSKTLYFYLVTPKGVRTVSFAMTDTEKSDSAAQTLYAYGQQVLTELRQITPLQK